MLGDHNKFGQGICTGVKFVLLQMIFRSSRVTNRKSKILKIVIALLHFFFIEWLTLYITSCQVQWPTLFLEEIQAILKCVMYNHVFLNINCIM